MSLYFGQQTDWHDGTTSSGEVVKFCVGINIKYTSAEENELFSEQSAAQHQLDESTSTFISFFRQGYYKEEGSRASTQVRRLLASIHARSVFE